MPRVELARSHFFRKMLSNILINACAGPGTPEPCAHALIRRLAWGGVRTSLLLEADAAADAAQQQLALEALDLPDGVASVAAQPGTAALSLRCAPASACAAIGCRASAARRAATQDNARLKPVAKRRMLVHQTGLPKAASCIVVGAAALQRVAQWCPPACQLISPRDAVLSQMPQGSGLAVPAAHSLGHVQDILRHVVGSHTADGTRLVYSNSTSPVVTKHGVWPICILLVCTSMDANQAE